MSDNQSEISAIGERLAAIEEDISRVDKELRGYDMPFAGTYYESDDAEEKFSSVWAKLMEDTTSAIPQYKNLDKVFSTPLTFFTETVSDSWGSYGEKVIHP